MNLSHRILRMADDNVWHLIQTRYEGKEKFLSNPKNQLKEYEDLYDNITNSKCGLIKIEHSKTGEIHSGFTAAFGENIGCYISNEDSWYITSIIKHIDWDKGEFNTLNSVYKFEFEEIPINDIFKICYFDESED